MALHTILVLGLCAQWVNSLAFFPAKATQSGEWESIGWTPVPTNAPKHELMKRQDLVAGLGSTMFRASNDVLGYTRDIYTYGTGATTSTSHWSYYLCLTAEKAFYQPAITPTNMGRIGCCGNGYCDAPTACVQLEDWSADCKNRPCETESLTLKCTGTRPYCATISLVSRNAQGYTCGSYPSSTKLSVYESKWYSYSSSYSYTTVSYSQFLITESASSTSATATSTTSRILTSSTSTDTPLPTITPVPSATPVGAIVGGAVGGFAVLALIGFALFFLISKHRKEKRQNVQQMDYSVVHQHQQPLSPPIYVTGGGDKHTSMHSQAQFGSASPMSGATSSGMGRESFMSGPGFDGAGMLPYERQELETTTVSTIPSLPTVPMSGDGRNRVV